MIALVHASLAGPVPSADFPKIAWAINVRASSTKSISQDIEDVRIVSNAHQSCSSVQFAVSAANFPKIAWTVIIRASSTKGISQDHRRRQDCIAYLCTHLQTHPHRPELRAS